MRILARATAFVRRIVDAVLIALILVVLSGVILGKVVPLTGRQTIIVGGGSMEPAIPHRRGDRRRSRRRRRPRRRRRRLAPRRQGPTRSSPTGSSRSSTGPTAAGSGRRATRTPNPDPTPVPASDIEGRVQLAIPLAGYLLALLSIPAGVLFVIGLAATLLAIAWLLESLELDKIDRDRAARRRDQSPVVGLGEPIPARHSAVARHKRRVRPGPSHHRRAARAVAGDPQAAQSMAGRCAGAGRLRGRLTCQPPRAATSPPSRSPPSSWSAARRPRR